MNQLLGVSRYKGLNRPSSRIHDQRRSPDLLNRGSDSLGLSSTVYTWPVYGFNILLRGRSMLNDEQTRAEEAAATETMLPSRKAIILIA